MSNDPAATRTRCPDPDALGRLLRDELVEPQAGDVEEHVGTCPACQRVLQCLIGGLPGTVLPPEGAGRRDEPPPVPGHEILGVLGEGGMGVVYKARQTGVGRVVALKMIRGGAGSADERTRFRMEAAAAAKLTHPGIARVYEFGECAGTLYFTLEFCDGGSLAAKLDGTPWPAAAAARLTEMLADAVAAAHKLGIVHRDLKPANVLLASPQGPDGGTVTDPSARTLLYAALRAPHGAVPKVADFGISKRLDSPDGPTATGVVVGTPSYMSPEQASGEGKRVGPPADVYALGAVMYELLTGRPPFKAQGVLETLELVRYREPVAVRDLNPACPRDLETICLKCLQKAPEKRYAGAAQLADDLRRFQENRPIVARPVGRAEQFAKWVTRNKGLSAGLAVAALVLVAGSIVSTVFGLESARQAEAAKNNADTADAKTVEAQKATLEARTAQGQEKEARKKAEDAADQTQSRLGRHFVENGHRLLRTDPFGSLLWFAEAAKWDTGQPERVAIHQTRTAAFLAQGPKLVHVLQTRQEGGLRRYETQFTPDGTRLITTTGREACVWELSTGELACDPIPHAGWNRIGLSRDGRRLIAISPEGSARLLDARTGKPIGEPLQIPAKIEVTSFSADGRRFLCQSWGSSWDNKPTQCRVWDTETVKPVSPVIEVSAAGMGSSVSCGLSRDGQHLTTSTKGLQQLRVVATGEVVVEKKEPEHAYLWFTPDGKQLIFAGRSKLQLLDPANGAEVTTLHEVGRGEELYAHFSPDGRYMLAHAFRSNTAGREVRVWDTANWKLACEPLRCNSYARGFFTPDGQSVVTRSRTEVIVWDIATGRPRTPALPVAETSETSDAIVSPDGRLIATSSNTDARIYDASTGDPVVPVLVHATAVRMMAFGPDGRFFATGSEDGVVRVWDLLPVLEGPANALGTVPVAWPAPPDRVAFRPDGLGARTLAVVADAGTPPPGTNSLRVRDGATGDELVPPIRHLERIWATGFSPDGRHVLTLGGETAPPTERSERPLVLGREARIWDAATGNPVTAPLAHDGAAAVETRLSPDGRVAVTRNADGRVQLWDAARGWPYGTPVRVEAARLNVWFGSSPEDVLLADDRGTLRGFAASGSVPAVEFPHGARVRHAASQSVVTTRGGFLRLVLTAGDDGRLRVWNAATGKEARTPLEHDGPITHFEMNPRGLVVTASEDKTARIWDALKEDAAAIPPLKHDSEVIHASFSPDLKTVVTLCKDGTVKLWDAAQGTPGDVQLKNPGRVREVWWSRGARPQLVTVGEKSARLWDTTSGEPIGSGVSLGEKVLFAVDRSANYPTPRGLTLSPSGLAQAWDLATGKPDGRADQLKLDGARVVGLAMFTDNRAVTADGTLWSWSPYRAHAPSSTGLAPLMTDARYTPDGRNVVTSATDGTVRVWEAATGRMVRELRDARPVRSVVLSRDGRYLASLPAAKLWEVGTGKELPPLQGTAPGGHFEFSPDGESLIGYGSTARVWRVRTGLPLTKEIAHPIDAKVARSNLTIRGVSFSGDGKRILTVAYQDRDGGGIVNSPPKDPPKGEARVWDAATGEPVTPPLRHKAGPVTHAGFGPSGDTVLTSGGGEARVWDAATGRPVTPPLTSAGVAACFSPDGRLVATVGEAARRVRGRAAYTAQVWESATGHPVTPPTATDDVTGAAFSADGRFVILSSPQKVRAIDLRPPLLPVDDLLLHTRLASGRSLDSSGDFVTYPAAGLLADFAALRARNPGDARFRVGDHAAWTRAQAAEAESARNWPLARACLDTLVAANPDDAGLLLRRAAVLAAVGDWEAAAADYDAAIAHGNNDGPVWRQRGLALAGLEKWKEAVESFTRAEELGVKDWSVWYQRAAARCRLGEWDQASADLDAALREPGAAWSAYELRALVCLKRGDADGYRKLCARVLDLTKSRAPNDQAALLRICVLGPDALGDYGPLLDFAEDRNAPQAAAGFVRYRAGKTADAVKRINVTAPAAGQSLGLTGIEYDLLGAMAYHRAGKPAEAKKMYDRAATAIKQARADGRGGVPYLPDARNHLRPPPWERQLGIELLHAESSRVLAEEAN